VEQAPRNGRYKGRLWEDDWLLPGTYRTFRFHMTKLCRGESAIRYSVVSAEGAKIEGRATVEI
jgi:hypothetical protein